MFCFCPKCSWNVSSTALSCPNCGTVLNSSQNNAECPYCGRPAYMQTLINSPNGKPLMKCSCGGIFDPPRRF